MVMNLSELSNDHWLFGAISNNCPTLENAVIFIWPKDTNPTTMA
jgi:hypothetical protein